MQHIVYEFSSQKAESYISESLIPKQCRELGRFVEVSKKLGRRNLIGDRPNSDSIMYLSGLLP